MKPLYPENWEEISRRIRFQRAGARREWRRAHSHRPHPDTGTRVVLRPSEDRERIGSLLRWMKSERPAVARSDTGPAQVRYLRPDRANWV